MKIYLLDQNRKMCEAWSRRFIGLDNVEIVNDTFSEFMLGHPTIEGIVSPANSFGIMDGGYDKAIIDCLGRPAQYNVFCMLNIKYNNYQPVGTCMAVPYDMYTILHTPTMRYPEKIKDDRVVYNCMYSCLNEAKKSKLNSVVIPAFGACTGMLDFDVVAQHMYNAYMVYNKPNLSGNTWEVVHDVLRKIEQID